MKKERYAFWCLARSLATLRIQAARFTKTATPNTVHDLRVALRRTRTLLRAFQSLFGYHVQTAANSFRSMNRLLGKARDSYIAVRWLKTVNSRRRNFPTFLALVSRFQRNEKNAVREARNFLPRFWKEVGRLSTDFPVPDAERNKTRSYGKWVRKRLSKRRRKLARQVDQVKDENSPAVHGVRIEAKKLRYLAETLPDRKKPVRRLIKLTKHAQKVLGDIHDLARLVAAISSHHSPSADYAVIFNEKRHQIFRRYEKILRRLPIKLKKEIAKA